VGNIRVKTPSTVDGYLDDDEATGQMFRGGWFYPNDVGLLRGPDQLTLVDRKDNILNIGGRKFSPAPFEEAARAIPFVADCHVTSLVGRQGSSRVVVLVVCRQPTERSVVEAEFRRIRPRHFGLIDVQLVDQIPRTANGKVRRDGVKELHDERVCIRVG
jgi:fatty-acyl-CoA synthase